MTTGANSPLGLMAFQPGQTPGPTPASPAASDTLQTFNTLLTLLITQQISASLGGLGSGDSSPLAGLTNSNPADPQLNNSMPLMLSLLEQLLAQQIQGGQTAETGAAAPAPAAAGSQTPELRHINQFEAEKQVGGDGVNSNCGPTSLVMALHQLGLRVAGESADTNDGQAVDLARKSMAASKAVDGVDGRGNRVEAEHSGFTNFSDLTRGAKAAGATARMLTATPAAIQKALESGGSVIVSGTFVGKYPLPWTGDRGPDNQSAPGNATAHLIQVSAYDPATNTFTVHDPARRKPLQVTPAALKNFMAGNAGALGLWR